jgi:hypothetical protein
MAPFAIAPPFGAGIPMQQALLDAGATLAPFGWSLGVVASVVLATLLANVVLSAGGRRGGATTRRPFPAARLLPPRAIA